MGLGVKEILRKGFTGHRGGQITQAGFRPLQAGFRTSLRPPRLLGPTLALYPGPSFPKSVSLFVALIEDSVGAVSGQLEGTELAIGSTPFCL